MNTISKIFITSGLVASLFLPSLAGAKSVQVSTISDASAKRLIRQVIREDAGGRFKWGVRLTTDAQAIGFRGFVANVKWGKGPHKLIATPTYGGIINMNKTPGDPKGKDRVTELHRAFRK